MNDATLVVTMVTAEKKSVNKTPSIPARPSSHFLFSKVRVLRVNFPILTLHCPYFACTYCILLMGSPYFRTASAKNVHQIREVTII